MQSTELVSNAQMLEKIAGTRTFYMNRAMVPQHFVVDPRNNDILWPHIAVACMPMGPKRTWGMIPPAAAKELRDLQKEWGTGADSFPIMIFFPTDTLVKRGEWAMVRSNDFERTPKDLLAIINRTKEDIGVQDVEHWIRSLELVYTAVFGKRPPGNSGTVPLKELPVTAF